MGLWAGPQRSCGWDHGRGLSTAVGGTVGGALSAAVGETMGGASAHCGWDRGRGLSTAVGGTVGGASPAAGWDQRRSLSCSGAGSWAGPHLQPWMRVELVQKVHEQVDLEGAHAQDHMLLRLGPVAAVVAPRLLPLHPQVDEFLKLQVKRVSAR